MNDPEDPRRPSGSRIHTDETGHSVWDDTVKTANFELVSTERLKQLLAEDDAAPREAMRDLASGKAEGYLAEDSSTGMLKIIDDDDLQALLDAQNDGLSQRRPAAPRSREAGPPPPGPAGDDELALVSTQTLRQILEIPDPDDGTGRAKPGTAPKRPSRDDGGGFDPYNSG